MGEKGVLTMWRLQQLQLLYFRLRGNSRGQDMIEYALLVGLLSIIAFGMFPSSYVPSLTHIWHRVSEVMCSLTGTCED